MAMFDTRIEILEYTEERDEYNDLTKSFRRVAVCYAQRTENGGRENLYAGRIVHENEVVYTIRWQPDLRPDGRSRRGVSAEDNLDPRGRAPLAPAPQMPKERC